MKVTYGKTVGSEFMPIISMFFITLFMEFFPILFTRMIENRVKEV